MKPEILNPDSRFEALRVSLREKRESDLRVDQYYLSEHDGDTWYSEKDFKTRSAKIDSQLSKTEEQIDNEINLLAINIVFSENLEKPKETGNEVIVFVREEKTIIQTPTELH